MTCCKNVKIIPIQVYFLKTILYNIEHLFSMHWSGGAGQAFLYLVLVDNIDGIEPLFHILAIICPFPFVMLS